MYTEADLINIRACIASGVMETRFADGRSVKYQSLAEMIRAEERIIEAISAAAPDARPRRRVVAYRNGC